MNRGALAVVAVLLAGAAARTSTYAERVSEFRDRCVTAYANLGGGRDARGMFPTPELRLVSAGGGPVLVGPGQAAVVKARGRIPPRSLVLFDCDDLEVTIARQTTSEVEARVRAPLLALPRTCHLSAFAPVTAFSRSIEAVRIAGTWAWRLELSNGMRAEVAMRAGPSGVQARSVWWEGDRPLGDRAVQVVDVQAGGGMKVKLERTAEDVAASSAASAEAAHTYPTGPLYQQVHALERKIKMECERSVRSYSCIQETLAQLNPLKAQLESNQAQQKEALLRHPVGCDELQLTAAEDGTVHGTALHCARSAQAEVKGKVSVGL